MNLLHTRLGRIDLETNLVHGPMRVRLESFLKFSYLVSEELEDLVAQYRHDSVRLPPPGAIVRDMAESTMAYA